jgi:hypothetical protein
MLTCGCEAWTVRERDKGKIKEAEMKFMRRMAGCTHLGHKNNLDIIKLLNTQPITVFMENYRRDFKGHTPLKNPITNQKEEDFWEDPSRASTRQFIGHRV